MPPSRNTEPQPQLRISLPPMAPPSAAPRDRPDVTPTVTDSLRSGAVPSTASDTTAGMAAPRPIPDSRQMAARTGTDPASAPRQEPSANRNTEPSTMLRRCRLTARRPLKLPLGRQGRDDKADRGRVEAIDQNGQEG